MNVHDDRALKVTPETRRRYEMMRRKLVKMLLFGTYADDERALCGADTSSDELRGVNGYLEDRLYGLPVGTVCEGCKALAVPFAESLIRDLEAGGRVDEAEEYRQLADTLARETGLDRCAARRATCSSMQGPLLRFRPRCLQAA